MKLYGSNNKKRSNGSARQTMQSGNPNDIQKARSRNYREEDMNYSKRAQPSAPQTVSPERLARQKARNAIKKKRRKKRIIIVLTVLVLLAAALVIWYKASVKPPDVSDGKNDVVTPSPSAVVTEDDGAVSPSTEVGRNPDEYTFVLLGTDDDSINTDTIMVAKFNVSAGTFNVVSVPRDTLVNVSWAVKKVNSIYSATDGPEGVVEGLSDILGFEVDFYVVVDLDAFVKCVDAIGGVWYDVPDDMDYESDNIDIHLTAGYQLLMGDQAIQYVRFRSGYVNADIGRIEAQQGFLKAAAEQIIEKKDELSLSTLANVFLNDVDTDLTYGNVIWFAQQFLKMDSMNITFNTLPGNTDDYVYQGGMDVSYVTIYVDEWLEMINQYLNPFTEDITRDEVSILTRDADTGELYSTNGVYQDDESWGNG